MIFLHAGYFKGHIRIWGERSRKTVAKISKKTGASGGATSPYDSKTELHNALITLGIPFTSPKKITIWLPTVDGIVCPSNPIIAPLPEGNSGLAPWKVTAFTPSMDDLISLLAACGSRNMLAPGILAGEDLRYWAAATQFGASLVVRQQYLPSLSQVDEKYFARWEPIYTGEEAQRLAALATAMPAAARAFSNGEASPETPAQLVLESFVTGVVDYLVRPTGDLPKFDTTYSLHDRWLNALLTPTGRIQGDTRALQELADGMRRWREPMAYSLASPYRLIFRLEEPEEQSELWNVRYLMQPVDDPSLLVPVSNMWNENGEGVDLIQRGNFHPRDYLLASLGSAALLSPKINESLQTAEPAFFSMNVTEAFDFLSNMVPLLESMGFGVLLPTWWTRRGAKMRLAANAKMRGVKSSSRGSSGIGMGQIVEFEWSVAVGDQEVTLEELQSLAEMKSPLIKMRGQWVEMNKEDLQHALKLMKSPVSKMSGRDFTRMALGAVNAPGGLHIDSVTAFGDLGEMISQLNGSTPYALLDSPPGLTGILRPYQSRGYSWLAFLRRWGLGACLADDMGLGKTIQTLALLQNQREEGEDKPVLLICPTSVVTNWKKEAERFTPELNVLIHHGSDRRREDEFVQEAGKHALVISSYALLHRDLDDIMKVNWAGAILDEAQHIKNSATKVAQAARSLNAGYRIALTGTPVENHVGELWSIMSFLNPGLLGTPASFRENYFKPIQLVGDQEAAQRLKRLTGPFLLRRLKTDRTIITDLPDKQEMTVYCPLTREQASLYMAVAKAAEESLETLGGIQRKGVVLATLTRLKQICNHPAQYLGDGSAIAGRSGKLERLTEMLEEILEIGDRALIFTQFTEMGEMLQRHIQETFGQEALYLHGGVARDKRDIMVERFQQETGGPPIFLLSLKAGGTGLNITRANHVFHFDRWWNPAVENQATDRAFRIGQTRNVQVHKFVCAGTLEEKIAAMIERKREIAENVVGTGEGWLTELNTDELKSLFALGAEAIAE